MMQEKRGLFVLFCLLLFFYLEKCQVFCWFLAVFAILKYNGLPFLGG